MCSLNNDDSVYNILDRASSLKYKLILDSLIVGVFAAVVIVLYRYLASFFGERILFYFPIAKSRPIIIVGLVVGFAFLAFIVNKMTKAEPMISGSGIPQVEGVLRRKLSYSWIKVLILKFLGGVICLAVGMSVGREGPSIQMGACAGEAVYTRKKRLESEKKYLITAGASAGLAAAFGAPLAGVMFALEEVHKNFSPLILISSMVSAITADFVTKNFFGIVPSLSFDRLVVMPLKYYWAYAVLGLVVGVSGYLFNNGIMKSKKIYSNLKVDSYFKILIPFMASLIIGIYLPMLSGGGHDAIMDVKVHIYAPIIILGLFVVKYIFTLVCFGSGVPGGIFFPLLAIGSLLGNFLGVVFVKYLGIPEVYLVNFVVLAMAAHFAATVKAPITGIILIFEMTGSFEQLLPLSLVVFIALIVSDMIGVEPIYESLLRDVIKKNPGSYVPEKDKKTLMEFSVNLDSYCVDKMVKEISWPEEILLVAIYRDTKEIIPKGMTRLREGDMITLLTDQSKAPDVLEFMESITETL